MNPSSIDKWYPGASLFFPPQTILNFAYWFEFFSQGPDQRVQKDIWEKKSSDSPAGIRNAAICIFPRESCLANMENRTLTFKTLECSELWFLYYFTYPYILLQWWIMSVGSGTTLNIVKGRTVVGWVMLQTWGVSGVLISPRPRLLENSFREYTESVFFSFFLKIWQDIIPLFFVYGAPQAAKMRLHVVVKFRLLLLFFFIEKQLTSQFNLGPRNLRNSELDFHFEVIKNL